MTSAVKLTRANLQERCNYWLEQFGLVEWMGERSPGVPRVRAKFRSKAALEKSFGYAVDGSCSWQAEHCTADIEIARGKEEPTLVHEVLHIVLDGHTSYDADKYSELHERSINRIAKLVTSR